MNNHISPYAKQAHFGSLDLSITANSKPAPMGGQIWVIHLLRRFSYSLKMTNGSDVPHSFRNRIKKGQTPTSKTFCKDHFLEDASAIDAVLWSFRILLRKSHFGRNNEKWVELICLLSEASIYLNGLLRSDQTAQSHHLRCSSLIGGCQKVSLFNLTALAVPGRLRRWHNGLPGHSFVSGCPLAELSTIRQGFSHNPFYGPEIWMPDWFCECVRVCRCVRACV